MTAIKNFFIKHKTFFVFLFIIVVIVGALSAIALFYRGCGDSGTTGNEKLESLVTQMKQSAEIMMKEAAKIDSIVTMRDSIEANRNSTIINIFKNEKLKEWQIIQNPVTNKRVSDLNNYYDSLYRAATEHSTEW